MHVRPLTAATCAALLADRSSADKQEGDGRGGGGGGGGRGRKAKQTGVHRRVFIVCSSATVDAHARNFTGMESRNIDPGFSKMVGTSEDLANRWK